MKKLLAILLIPVFIFAASNAEIEKKLDYLIERMNKMEKLLNSKDQEIEKLKKEVKQQKVETKKEFSIKSCDKIKIKNFIFKNGGTILPYYTFNFSLENNYPYDVAKVSGKIYIKDISDDITILTDFITVKKTITKEGGLTSVSKRHPIMSDLEKVLKDEPYSNIKVTFVPTTVTFTNGKKVSCGALFGINF